MDKVESVLLHMTCNCYLAKLSIKDAYCSLPDRKEHQAFLTGEVRLKNLLILVKC